jgi:hypothetical protein
MFPSIVQFSIVPTNVAVAHAVWKSNGIMNLHLDEVKYDCLETLDGDRTQRLLRSDVPISINEAAQLGSKVHSKIEDLQLLEEDLKKVLRGYAKEVRSVVKLEHRKTPTSVCIPYTAKANSAPEYVRVSGFNTWRVNQDAAVQFEVNFPFQATEVFSKKEQCSVKSGRKSAMLDALRKRGMSNADVSAWFAEFFDDKHVYAVVEDFEDKKMAQPDNVREFLDQIVTQSAPSVTF